MVSSLVFDYHHCYNTQSITLIFSSCLLHVDIDDCSHENGGCEQKCNNQEGKFYCSCGHGFLINDDHKSCDGIYILYVF